MSANVRWDGFIAQLQTRASEVRAEITLSTRTLIASLANGGDTSAMTQQWTAANARLSELERRIVDTWHAKVSDAFDSEGISPQESAAALERGIVAADEMADAREELEHALFAELARIRFQHGSAAVRAVICNRCNAGMNPPLAWGAVEISCSGCGAVLLYQPNELLMSAGAIGTHHVSQSAVVEQWRAMVAADRNVRRQRPPVSLALLQLYERAQIAYWRAYLTQRSWFEPVLARDIDMEIRSRMEQWYVYRAEQEPAWNDAGRPRAI
jgi:hypothetical protein